MKKIIVTLIAALIMAAGAYAQNDKPNHTYKPKEFPKGGWYFIGKYSAGCNCYTDTLGVFVEDTLTLWNNKGMIRIYDTLIFRNGYKYYGQTPAISDSAGVAGYADSTAYADEAAYATLADSSDKAVRSDSAYKANYAWTLQTKDTTGVYEGAASNPACNNFRTDTITGCSTDWVVIRDSLGVNGKIDCDTAIYIDGQRVLYGNGNIGNIFMGYNCGIYTTGMSNTATGSNALYLNYDGIYNVAFGFYSLRSQIHSNMNTSIGYAAGASQIGNNNIYLGYESGYNVSDSLDGRLFINSIARATQTEDTTLSIIYGKQAAATADQQLWLNARVYSPQPITSYVRFIHPDDSVSLALPNGTLTLWHQKAKGNLWMNGGVINDVKLYGATLDQNTIIGTTAGITLQDAENNVIVGESSGQSIVTGDKNTLIGSDVLTTATTISNTTAIGFHAGRDALLGNSIFIGAESNITNNSDSGVIVIGYDVKSTDANQLHIGLRDSTGASHGSITQVIVMDSILLIPCYPSQWQAPSGISGHCIMSCDSVGETTEHAYFTFNSDGTVGQLISNSTTINANSSVADKFNIYASGGVLTFENRLWGSTTPTVCTNPLYTPYAQRTCKITITY